MSIDNLDDQEPMEASGETVVALDDLGVIASPSGEGALLLHGEEGLLRLGRGHDGDCIWHRPLAWRLPRSIGWGWNSVAISY